MTEPTVPESGLTPPQLADIRWLLVRVGNLSNVAVGEFDVHSTDGALLGSAVPPATVGASWTFVPAGDGESETNGT